MTMNEEERRELLIFANHLERQVQQLKDKIWKLYNKNGQ